MSNHHPAVEILFDYSAGSLNEGVLLAVQTHVALCRDCRNNVELLQSFGGTLLEEIEPEDVSPDALDRVLSRIDQPEHQPGRHLALDEQTDAIIPSPLRAYLKQSLRDLAWKNVGRAIEEFRLPLSAPGMKASLMRLKSGNMVPRHSHGGLEYTVVLAGGFRDNGDVFERGDFVARDPSDVHQPRVDDDEDCLCLVVLDAPIKLTGLFGKLVNPFLRI